jgi:hypothetical protein
MARGRKRDVFHAVYLPTFKEYMLVICKLCSLVKAPALSGCDVSFSPTAPNLLEVENLEDTE